MSRSTQRTRQPLNDEQLVDLYRQGLSCAQVARHADLPTEDVRARLLRSGIVAPGSSYRVFAATEEQYREWYVNQELGLTAISKKLGVGIWKVQRDLRALRIARRPVVVHAGLDCSWFDAIDTDIKAYALGLIWTDGTIGSKSIAIALQERDRSVLERLHQAAGGGGMLRVRQAGQYVVRGQLTRCRALIRLGWSSTQMVRALGRLGLCKDKSHVLPSVVLPPSQYMRAFVRGLVDGDGYLSLRKSGNVMLGFSNYNSDLLAIATRYFNEVSVAERARIGRGGNAASEIRTNQVIVSGTAAVLVARDLYLSDPNAIAIPRKLELAKRLDRWGIEKMAM